MRKLNYKRLIQEKTHFIQSAVRSAGFKKMILGISGGVDSALAATLAVEAIGEDNVYFVMMPYGTLNTVGLEDGMLLVEKLKIPKEQVLVVNIADAVTSILTHAPDADHIRRGNIMARVRMIYLFDLAKKLSSLVCGTENRTENYLGYFTRFGDEASDIEPILDLYKTEVWEIAKFLAVPEKIITNVPTAGLWEEQTDEQELGFTYKEADQILYLYFDKKLSAVEIVKEGIQKELVTAVLERVAKNDFKHKLPYVYK